MCFSPTVVITNSHIRPVLVHYGRKSAVFNESHNSLSPYRSAVTHCSCAAVIFSTGTYNTDNKVSGMGSADKSVCLNILSAVVSSGPQRRQECLFGQCTLCLYVGFGLLTRSNTKPVHVVDDIDIWLVLTQSCSVLYHEASHLMLPSEIRCTDNSVISSRKRHGCVVVCPTRLTSIDGTCTAHLLDFPNDSMSGDVACAVKLVFGHYVCTVFSLAPPSTINCSYITWHNRQDGSIRYFQQPGVFVKDVCLTYPDWTHLGPPDSKCTNLYLKLKFLLELTLHLW